MRRPATVVNPCEEEPVSAAPAPDSTGEGASLVAHTQQEHLILPNEIQNGEGRDQELSYPRIVTLRNDAPSLGAAVEALHFRQETVESSECCLRRALRDERDTLLRIGRPVLTGAS
jgi:hypothetical protein